uniref:Uncharacterized protein n=1 Tax=Mammaliicoccus phage MSShimriz1 TaxID=3230127 RepID=A0AAU8GUI2_9VIRU
MKLLKLFLLFQKYLFTGQLQDRKNCCTYSLFCLWKIRIIISFLA